MTKSELTTLITAEIKGLSSYIVTDDYSNACYDASRETGWSLPVTGDFKIKWMKERAKRALFFYLLSETAYKFQFKQIHLEHRFKHLKELIDKMDADFLAAQESNPEEFAAVDSWNLFGTKIDAGFAYDRIGQDLTYEDENIVVHEPNENS